MPSLEAPAIRIPRHNQSNDAAVYPSLLERTEPLAHAPKRSHQRSPVPVVRRIDELIALIRERGVCNGLELAETGKAKLSIYTPQLEALGFRAINVTFSKSARVRRYDLFENSFKLAKYYFEEPFDEKVALYFGNLLRAPVDSNRARLLSRALQRGGFNPEESRAIISVRYQYSESSLRDHLRQERFVHEHNGIRDSSRAVRND